MSHQDNVIMPRPKSPEGPPPNHGPLLNIMKKSKSKSCDEKEMTKIFYLLDKYKSKSYNSSLSSLSTIKD